MRLVTFRPPGGDPHVGEVEDERVLELAAPTMVDWLAGEGRTRSGQEFDLGEVELLAPVPEPPSLRDFFAFEGHVAAGFKRRGMDRIPEQWYQAPVFYFSNPASIHGPGEPVRRPEGCNLLDFELEIAAVIGAAAEGSEPGIAAFTLMNDWSARDVQAAEMTVGLGPAKGKDFGTSLGPWLVTPDELAYEDGRLRVQARVEVNGAELPIRCKKTAPGLPRFSCALPLTPTRHGTSSATSWAGKTG